MSNSKPEQLDSPINVRQLDSVSMITIRADLSNPETVAEIEKAVGITVPDQRQISGNTANGLAWMSPDELLLLRSGKINVPALVKEVAASISGASLVVDVSHARALFSLSGEGSREVLAKGAPIDLSKASFKVGDFRRTRMGQVAVAFWLEDGEVEQFTLICFASVAEFMDEWLTTASAPGSLPEIF